MADGMVGGRTTRRVALRLIGATGLTLLAACTPAPAGAADSAPVSNPNPPASGTTAATSAPAAAGQPKTGGTLRVAMAEPTPLDGHTYQSERVRFRVDGVRHVDDATTRN